MKNYVNKNRKYAKAMLQVMCFALCVIVCAAMDSATIVDSIATLAMAGAAAGLIDGIITTDKVRAVADKLDMSDIESYVTIFMPEKALLSSLIADYGRRVKTASDIHRWYTEGYVPLVDKTKHATVGTPQSITMGTPTTLTVDNVQWYEKNQTLYVDSSTLLSATGGHLELLVRSVTVAGIDVVLTNGLPATAYSIPDGTNLIFAGVTKSELDWSANTKVVMPQDMENFIQIFMGEVFMSERQMKIIKEVNYGLKDLFRQAITRFKATKEMNFLFGSGVSVQDAIANNRKQISKGLLNFDIQRFPSPASWNASALVDFLDKSFAAPESSDSKYVLAGSGFINKLETFLFNSEFVSRYRSAEDSKGVLNLRWSNLESSHGLVHIKKHPLFNEIGRRDMAIVVDPAYIGQASLTPMEHHSNTLEDNRRGKDVNAASELVREESCLTIYSPLTHTLWY